MRGTESVNRLLRTDETDGLTENLQDNRANLAFCNARAHTAIRVVGAER